VRTRPVDEDAFAALYGRWKSSLTMCARLGGATAEDAEEVVNDAFVRLLRRQAAIPTAGQAYRYALRTVRRGAWRAAALTLRRRRRERSDTARSLPQLGSVDPMAAEQRREQLAAITAALPRLPEREQDVILHTLRGEGTAEIARRLGLEENVVRVYLSRARKRLADLLTGWAPAAGGLAVVVAAEPVSAEVVRDILHRAAAGGWGKTSLLAAIGLVLAGGAAGGWAWAARDSSPAPLPTPPVRVFTSLERGNWRAFDEHVRDRLQEALDDMAEGDGGRGMIDSVEVFASRVIVTATVTHGRRDRSPTRLWLAVETATLNTFLLADVDGSGFYWPVQFQDQPVRWKQGFPNHRLRLGAFDRARRALLAMPPTPQVTADERRLRQEIRPVLEAVAGDWERAGQRYRIAQADNGFALELYRTHPHREAVAITWNVVWRLPDGRVMANLIYDCGVVTISPDGRRITGPTGEEWRRVPPPD
jgi:RNA polymerase sigma factor (sigma-70 family)